MLNGKVTELYVLIDDLFPDLIAYNRFVEIRYLPMVTAPEHPGLSIFCRQFPNSFPITKNS